MGKTQVVVEKARSEINGFWRFVIGHNFFVIFLMLIVLMVGWWAMRREYTKVNAKQQFIIDTHESRLNELDKIVSNVSSRAAELEKKVPSPTPTRYILQRVVVPTIKK